MQLLVAPDVLVEVLDGEAVLLALPDRTLTRLDPIGTATWELLAAGVPVADAAQELAERYGAPVDRVTTDVTALAERLVAEGLLVPA